MSPTSSEYFEGFGSFSSTILIFGGLVTLGLFILFFEQVVFTNQTAHHGAKRNIYWIASVFPMMTLMSLVALIIPRSSDVCLSVKMVYIAIGISHFTDLTMVMFGGEELLVERGGEDTFNLRLSPLCCCCRCLPRPAVTKYSLRLINLMTDQLPFAQATYYVIVLILLSADHITMGDVKPSGAFLWLNIFKLASALLGVYGFMILSRFSKGYLDDDFEYRRKSRSIQLLLLITNFQSMIFNIMANYGAFPCLPPFITPTVYKQTVDNSLYVLEMMVLGPYTYWQYHDQIFATPITAASSFRDRTESVSTTTTKNSTISTTITVDLSDMEGSTGESTTTTTTTASRNSRAHVATENEIGDTGVNSDGQRRNRSSSRDSKAKRNSTGNGDSVQGSGSRSRGRKGRENSRGSSNKSSSNGSNGDSREDSTKDKTSKNSKKKSTPATTNSQENQ
ncbi:hypothetical protein O3P69_009586 [Scylla paramamosain]|uniref:Organic solute transporter alpha-like protein n=1 Tax=Scylla paramamosain TaxID=85552 RepID=A0AAW0SVD2_SCYPA